VDDKEVADKKVPNTIPFRMPFEETFDPKTIASS
jgi:hypothetical protein